MLSIRIHPHRSTFEFSGLLARIRDILLSIVPECGCMIDSGPTAARFAHSFRWLHRKASSHVPIPCTQEALRRSDG